MEFECIHCIGTPKDTSVCLEVSNPNEQWATRRKRGRCNFIRRARSTTILFLLSLVVAYHGQTSMAYYQEYPTNAFSRTVNHNQQHHKRGNAVFRKLSSRKPGRILLKGATDDEEPSSDGLSELERKLMRRITRLEELVSKQEMEIHRLKRSTEELTASAEAFAQVIQLLREAGLQSDVYAQGVQKENDKESGESQANPANERNASATGSQKTGRVVESFDDSLIFGTAPASVSDAADAAGAAILAAVLGGKQRMLVDVRDAELSSDPETLVQFIELAILPIAAGLQGLKSARNRVKIVFPKVSQLLEYRRTMVLAAPEVVALSTLGFDPVERKDKLVVIVAPQPDDEEGLVAMRELLYPADKDEAIQQPVVVLNYHMLPVAGLLPEFETAYHLRLLSVQYMSGNNASEMLPKSESKDSGENVDDSEGEDESSDSSTEKEIEEIEDEALKAAMKHAQEAGMNHQGVTRAMVIRAYPRYVSIYVR